MDFNLFGSRKDSAEIKEAEDIKSATMPVNNNLNSTPSFNEPINNNQVVNSTSESFVNPFNNSQLNNVDNSSEEIDLNKEIEKDNISSVQQNNIPIPASPQNVQNVNPEPTIEKNESVVEIKKDDTYSKEEVIEIINETVEKVIEERWNQLVDKVNKVASWKEKQDAHLEMIKEDIVSMKDGVEKLEKRLISKVESYDKNILDVNSEIKALEKVFQKITPTLVNNVNELSKITRDLKEDKNISNENSLEN